ncbi:MAG: energy transducer TonB [Bacteroidales bacterium]|nr:energy transducer TonB [Bacteroidales bacterium]
MEAKKSLKADLEKKKGLYLEIGLVVALAIVLVAFNVKSYDTQVQEFTQRTAIEEIDEVVLNTQEDQPDPEPPEAPEITTEFEVVDDDKEIENELHVDMNDNANTEVQEFTPVEVTEEEVEKEEEIFVFVEENPSFPGGEEELYKYLRENIKYPQLARENNIEGKVFVQFVVEKNGSISNVKILKDIGSGCGAEAVRVVKAMPKWKPGKQRGSAVRAQFSLPISFKLS